MLNELVRWNPFDEELSSWHRDIDDLLIGAEGQSHAATLSVSCLTVSCLARAIPPLSRVSLPFRKQAGARLLQDRARS